MLSLADKLTVPQIFLNGQHVGGADDIIILLAKWDLEKKYSTPLERYQREIETEKEPSDPRLAIPTTPPVVQKPPPPRPNRNTAMKLPNGTLTSVLDVTTQLESALPIQNLSWNLHIYKNCFTGTAGIEGLMKHFEIDLREEAVQYGNYLHSVKMIQHVHNEHTFKDGHFYYRLNSQQNPKLLNSRITWMERVDPDSMSLLKYLTKLMGVIVSAVTDNKGKLDYIAARSHENYSIFEEAVCELQGVDMGEMGEKTRLAFGINLYNLMVTYAFMKVGVGMTNSNRSEFFSSVKFNIGGNILSFNDLEHGILRSNAKPYYGLSTQFHKSDPRMRFILKKADCRIHFALNCGAKSCPPIKKFTADAINEELRIVSQAFAEQDENVFVDEAKNELHLTKLMSWYKCDFVESATNLPEKVVTFLRGSKKEQLQRMIESETPISVKFNDYDWSTNASLCDTFDPSAINQNEWSPFKALCDSL